MAITTKPVEQTGSGTSSLLVIKDISNEYINFEGEVISYATLWDPMECREVEMTVADVFNANQVFLVSDGKGFAYIDDSFDDAPAPALKAAIAGKVNDAEIKAIEEWMADVAVSSEATIWDEITTRGQENYSNQEDCGYDEY